MTENDQQRVGRRIALRSYAWGLFAGLAVLVIGVLLGYRDLRHQQSHHVEDNVAEMSDTLAGVQGALNRLNALGHQDCEVLSGGSYDANLLAMQRELFLDEVMEGVGFYRDGRVVCTTGRGVWSNDTAFPEPDIVTDLGDLVWLELPIPLFEGDPRHESLRFSILQRGSYLAVLDRADLVEPLAWHDEWQLLADYGSFTVTLAGNADLSALPLGPGHIDATGVSSKACGGSVGLHCLAVRSDPAAIWQQYRVYAPSLVALAFWAAFTAYTLARRRLLEHYSDRRRILRGLENGSFYPVYQALVDLRTGQNVGCEITARFKDQFGEIPRDEFIPMVRELNKTWELTETVLAMGLAELARYGDWARRSRVSFNIYPEDLCSGAALELMNMANISHSHFRYVMEIREDVLLDEEQAIDTLARLEKAGFWMAMDHFGMGYSNVRMLTASQCRWIKIDESFVTDIENRSLRASLIPGIVSMAHAQNIAVVALGVDNPAQIEALLDAEVVWGQGQALGQAVDIATFHEQTLRAAEHLIGHEGGQAPSRLV